MNEELGMLLLDLPEIGKKKPYHFLFVSSPDDDLPEYKHYDVGSTYLIERILDGAYKCTRKEAEQFPQFKWVALSELEMENMR